MPNDTRVSIVVVRCRSAEQRRAVERIAAPRHDGRGQRQRQPLPAGELPSHHHRDRHDRNRQQRRADQPVQQLVLRRVVGAPERVDDHRRLVARRLHRADQVAGRHRGLVLDVSALEREVHRGAHPVEPVQRTLDAGSAGRAAHAAQVEIGGGHATGARPARRSRAMPTTASMPATAASSRVTSSIDGS